jgi:methionyl-tRNA formyltransferase
LFLDQIAQELDAVLSVRCLQIFGLPFIDHIQKKGGFIWNLHSGALPECRGAMPIFWTMMTSKPNVTLSLHKIVPKIDQGDVLAEKRFDYSSEKSLLEVSCDSIEYATSLLEEALEGKEKNILHPIPQRTEHICYYSYPKKHHVELFFDSGKKMLPQDPVHYVVSQLSGGKPMLENALEDHFELLGYPVCRRSLSS